MSDQMTATFTKCEHGNWPSHNALLWENEDGSIDHEDTDPCDGGTVNVKGVGRFGISALAGMMLRDWEKVEDERT